MNYRVNPSTKTRFDVLKRDLFTCQYCGKTAPNVELCVDHFIPVHKGGDNKIGNLITSCVECNSGKRSSLLPKDAAIRKIRIQIARLEEQIKNLRDIEKQYCNGMADIAKASEPILNLFEFAPTALGASKIHNLVMEFGVEKVKTATVLSIQEHYKGDFESCDMAYKNIENYILHEDSIAAAEDGGGM